MNLLTPAQLARMAGFKKRQAALLRRGMSRGEDLAAPPDFLKIAEDNAQSPDDLLDAIEAHLSKLESSLN